ncbi:MAG: DNA-3-methyladenine glycosylase 2 family protein [Acidobacteria bacterium]|nr:DNA-3-methyladenine glycosylase 2 family protein [Acidobacteriota bacterium]
MRKALTHLRSADPVMKSIIENVGPYKIVYREPDYTTLARSIIYQQVSGAAAATVLGRIHGAAARGGKLMPAKIISLGVDGLRPLGVSRQKASYLLDLSERTLARQLPFAKLAAMSDSEVIEHLTAVKGVGVWTAQMFLMFALQRPDVLPVGDLGVRNAIWKAYQLDAPPTPTEIETRGAAWRPYASVASWYLWRSLDGPAEI